MMFRFAAASSLNRPVGASTYLATLVSILHCGVMTAGCGTGLTGQTDSDMEPLHCWGAGMLGMADFMTEPSRGRRRAQTPSLQLWTDTGRTHGSSYKTTIITRLSRYLGQAQQAAGYLALGSPRYACVRTRDTHERRARLHHPSISMSKHQHQHQQ